MRASVKSVMDKPAAHSDARLGQSQFCVLHSSKKQKHNLPDVHSQSRGALRVNVSLLISALLPLMWTRKGDKLVISC